MAAWISRRVLVWALYDVASSTWIALVPTVLFALYYRNVIMAGAPMADLYWGITATCGLLIPGIIAPMVGARADAFGTRWRWIAAGTLACCAATMLMPLAGPGQVVAGSLLFVVAQGGYMLAAGLYDAYLPSLAKRGETGRVSAFGWGLGFAGGIAAVVLTVAFVALAPPAEGAVPTAAFPMIGALYAALAIPAIAGLRRIDLELRSQRMIDAPPTGAPARSPPVPWRKQPRLVRFLGAMFCINDAIVAVGYFSALYFQTQFNLTITDLMWLVLLYQLIALPATMSFGYLADRFSVHRAIYFSLAVWIAAVLLMVFGSGSAVPVIVVVLFASVIGSTQALLRALFATLIPAARSSELFGFNAMASRVSTVAGPLVYGVVSALTGSPPMAMLAVALIMAAGVFLLAGIPAPVESTSRPR